MATLEELHNELTKAMVAFNLRRADILQKAFDEGGIDRVMELENEFSAMRDARFEIIRRQFDANSNQFTALAERAKEQADAIEASVTSLSSTKELLDNMAAFINTFGRLLIVFGL